MENLSDQDFDYSSGSEAQIISDHDSDREHYLQVDRSSLRSLAEAPELAQKYKGKRVARSDLLESALESEPQSSSSSSSEPESESDMESIQEDAVVEQLETSTVQEPAVHDIRKGQCAKSQVALYDYFLDCRIQMQKIGNLVNALPCSMPADESIQKLECLFNELVDLKLLLLEHSGHTCTTTSGSTSEGWEKLMQLEKENSEFRDQTIEKWSSKVSAVSQKFKAINQSTMSQIKAILLDKQRLLKRTRVIRSDCDKMDGDSEIFDDQDFYQTLLKDFIESRTSSDPIQMNVKLVQLKQMQTRKKRRVDTRASKGRKIRFDPMEKLVNFMAPEPRGTWHDEMRESLFSSLFATAVQELPAVASDGFRIM